MRLLQHIPTVAHSATLDVKTRNYEYPGKTVTVTPPDVFFIGWLGDPSDKENDALLYSRVWFQSTDCIFKLPVKATMLSVDVRNTGQRPAESIFDDRPVWIDD